MHLHCLSEVLIHPFHLLWIKVYNLKQISLIKAKRVFMLYWLKSISSLHDNICVEAELFQTNSFHDLDFIKFELKSVTLCISISNWDKHFFSSFRLHTLPLISTTSWLSISFSNSVRPPPAACVDGHARWSLCGICWLQTPQNSGQSRTPVQWTFAQRQTDS